MEKHGPIEHDNEGVAAEWPPGPDGTHLVLWNALRRRCGYQRRLSGP